MMLEIRQAEGGDLGALWEIINEPSVLEVMPLPKPVTKKRVELWYESSRRSANPQIFVLEANEHVIGCMTITNKGLITIWIGGEYQNRGYGTKALAWLIDWAKNGGHKKLACSCLKTNKLALNFYEKFGFTKVGGKGDLVSLEKLL